MKTVVPLSSQQTRPQLMNESPPSKQENDITQTTHVSIQAGADERWLPPAMDARAVDSLPRAGGAGGAAEDAREEREDGASPQAPKLRPVSITIPTCSETGRPSAPCVLASEAGRSAGSGGGALAGFCFFRWMMKLPGRVALDICASSA